MKHILYAIICLTTFACRQTSDFYNPDSTITQVNEQTTDTIYGEIEKYIFSKIKNIDYIDNYLVVTLQNKDTVFQIIDTENDSIVAGFGSIGHAHNEFQNIKTIYCRKGGTDSPQIFVLDGIQTKIVDLEESIKEKKCILSNVIKENIDRYFHQIYHINDNTCFGYKKVSYTDARDAIYEEPLYYMTGGNNKFKWDIYPNVITPEWSNIVDAAYSNIIKIKPDGTKALNVPNFIDIITIFDLTNKKTLGIVNPDSYTYDFLEQEGTESKAKEYLRWFNTSACATDNCFIILKDGSLYRDVRNEKYENKLSSIYIYNWDGQLKASYILDKNILDIAYCEKNNCIYAVSNENKLYKYVLKL